MLYSPGVASLSVTKPVQAVLLEHGKSGWRELKRLQIPSLKPYQSTTMSMHVDGPISDNCEYRVEIAGKETCEGFWRMVDDTEDSVEFGGEWGLSDSDSRYYMNRERKSSTLGASVKFTFTGTKARAYGTLDSKSGGTFDVYLDGELLETIVLRWGGPMSKLYQTKRLPQGRHTLEFRVGGAFRDVSNAAIDAFAFESLDNQMED